MLVRLWGRGCSSDSSDSRLPIIRRGEGSTEETYDESYGDDREYHREDARSLSSDMYWSQHSRFALFFHATPGSLTFPPRLTDVPLPCHHPFFSVTRPGWCTTTRRASS